MEKIKIIGINVGSGGNSITGRGFFNTKDKTFCYIPIEEDEKQNNKFTFKDLNNPFIKNALEKPCHYDPEFITNTYGHIKRGFGDHILYKPDLLEDSNVYLFFYSTLNINHNPEKWGIFIIGFFEIEKIINTKKLSDEQILSLSDFKNNAHLRREKPKVDLLIKGTSNSKLFKQAIQLSKLGDTNEINPKFADLIMTVSGKRIIKNSSW